MLQTYTNLNGKPKLLDSITALDKEQSAKTGKDVVVAYSPVRPTQRRSGLFLWQRCSHP